MEEQNQKNLFEQYFNSPEIIKFRQQMEESRKQYEEECEDYWNSLDYDVKLKAFYSVVSRIVQAELKDRGTYRWALYDVFDFDMDSYGIGMDCGYLDLHNSIYTKGELKKFIQNLMCKYQLDTSSVDWEREFGE